MQKQGSSSQAELQVAVQGVYGLTLLREVLNDQPGQAFLAFLQTLFSSASDPAQVASAYSSAWQALATVAPKEERLSGVDAWQTHVISRLLDDSNVWSTQVEYLGSEQIAATLRAQAQRELRLLQRLFQLDARTLLDLTMAAVTPTLPALREAWVPWSDLTPTTMETASTDARLVLAQSIVESSDWAEMVTPLERYWSRYGTGELSRYRALRWQPEERKLVGIAHPDRIQLTNLVGHERQQKRLRANIEHFIARLPAHDILLYGAPGTGKSSTIKALINSYADQGLSLVEIRKEEIGDLPSIVSYLRQRAPRYLIFIDDLSFEDNETSYKVLKVLLEGTAEARPGNILVCATSNRINLVKENFADRGKQSDDVNWRDTMDEKQSLANRFGLRISYLSPDQNQYLNIVQGLVQQRGLVVEEETLRERALQWERSHAGRSGRVARQFVDDLEAEVKINQNGHQAVR
ncbi:MAG TPA: ATP-binding protein [Dictyobacter sp.]|jgi:predicted AAA+ superfamily ATPase|nr:ATP-binding protein [Dictyobacter sp.]